MTPKDHTGFRVLPPIDHLPRRHLAGTDRLFREDALFHLQGDAELLSLVQFPGPRCSGQSGMLPVSSGGGAPDNTKSYIDQPPT